MRAWGARLCCRRASSSHARARAHAPARLQAASEVPDDVALHSLMSKIALLCLHFPRLRLIWSRSLHATADLFQQLKAVHEEPDPLTAATVGVPLDAAGGGAAPAAESVVNESALDVLRRLPGARGRGCTGQGHRGWGWPCACTLAVARPRRRHRRQLARAGARGGPPGRPGAAVAAAARRGDGGASSGQKAARVSAPGLPRAVPRALTPAPPPRAPLP